jgi:hypothetical protein
VASSLSAMAPKRMTTKTIDEKSDALIRKKIE